MASWRNSSGAYGWVSWVFHWGMGMMIIGLIVIGYQAAQLPPAAEKVALLWWHKSFGLLALVLVGARLAWRRANPPPALPDAMSQLRHRLAQISHFTLYALMVIQPLSGVIMSRAAGYPSPFFALGKVPPMAAENEALSGAMHTVHEYGWWLLALLISLHLAAALHHHFVLRDGVLRRMLWPHGSAATEAGDRPTARR